MPKTRILFLCTGNSCRSQMAEGWAKHLHLEMDVFSAGTKPSRVDPTAIRVMLEVGIDISGHYSKHLDQFQGQQFDYVVTLCDDARDGCPVFPGTARRVHVGFPDPAQAAGSPEAVLQEFRRIRDLIGEFVTGLPGTLARVTDSED